MNEIIESAISQVNITFDPLLVLVLLMLGALIKHSKATVKINNVFIPLILVVVSMVYTLLKLPTFGRVIIVDAVASSIVNAGLAVFVHSSGKSIFDYLYTKKIVEAAVETLKEFPTEEPDNDCNTITTNNESVEQYAEKNTTNDEHVENQNKNIQHTEQIHNE